MSLEEASLSTNLSLHSPDHRAIAEIRLILAVATLVVVIFTSPFTSLTTFLSYGVIAAYVLSALALYWVALKRPSMVRQRLVYWLDAGWLLAIIGLTRDSDSPLFLLLLYPILVAAAQAGFVRGMVVSAGTVLAYVLLSVLLVDGRHSIDELMLEAGILLVLGFMMSRWAGAEQHLKRKLGALNRLGKLPGLRDEDEPFWTETLGELATYFGAGSALFVGRGEDGSYRIYEYETGKPAWSIALGDEQAAVFASVPEHWAIAWRSPLRSSGSGFGFGFGFGFGTARVVDMADGRALVGMDGRLQALAETLDSARWLSFSLHTEARYRGRIFLSGIQAFKCRLEWAFIQQLASQISLKWDNLLLARQLTRIAASGERERVSRDLHDGTVQPYLGLKYGLEALRRKMPKDDALAADVDELVRMTDGSILQLRGYIRKLRASERGGTYPALSAIRAQVQQFEEYSGLKVDVRAREFTLSEARLLEVRQLIAEGLSNIRRHTRARRVALDLVVEQDTLRIAFINPVARIAPPFKPRSLTERTAAMGGAVEVMRFATETVVKVVLPLWEEGRNDKHADQSDAGGRPPESVVGAVEADRGGSARLRACGNRQ
jgi:signal transduction histidine kinase